MADLPFPHNAVFLKVKEAAEVCRKDPKTIRRWILAGELTATRAGRGWLIARADLKAFLKARGNGVMANIL
ncbi:helix-turn-helix domain-containing protein [Primorskyibacter sp. S87]|uniref:helix-turn-helix domain-containing protein n=1 Tax=Primorskyibacter sp. S87 TaxID=3415126 RepID=UPI003C7B6699